MYTRKILVPDSFNLYYYLFISPTFLSFSLLVPPVVTAMSSSFLIHRLSGDNVTFLFTLSQAAPSVEISDIVWTHQSQNTTADVTGKILCVLSVKCKGLL